MWTTTGGQRWVFKAGRYRLGQYAYGIGPEQAGHRRYDLSIIVAERSPGRWAWVVRHGLPDERSGEASSAVAAAQAATRCAQELAHEVEQRDRPARLPGCLAPTAWALSGIG